MLHNYYLLINNNYLKVCFVAAVDIYTTKAVINTWKYGNKQSRGFQNEQKMKVNSDSTNFGY